MNRILPNTSEKRVAVAWGLATDNETWWFDHAMPSTVGPWFSMLIHPRTPIWANRWSFFPSHVMNLVFPAMEKYYGLCKISVQNTLQGILKKSHHPLPADTLEFSESSGFFPGGICDRSLKGIPFLTWQTMVTLRLPRTTYAPHAADISVWISTSVVSRSLAEKGEKKTRYLRLCLSYERIT